VDALSGVSSGVTASVGQATAGAPLSATVKVLGPTTIMKPVKDTSSAGLAGGVLPSRTGTAVVSLQPVLIRPGAAMTVTSSQTSAVQQASLAGRTGAVPASSTSASSVLAGVQQTVQDIVQQAQAQAARQNTFVTTSAAAGFPQQAPAATAGVSTLPTMSLSSFSPATAVVTAPDAAAASAQNKSSPYVMRLRNQRS